MPAVNDFAPDLNLMLECSPWFGSLSPQLRTDLLSGSELHRLSAGAMLFRQGDGPDGFYAVLRGHIKMSSLTGEGKESILAMLDPGSWFGEISLIDGLPRTHDATALDSVQLLKVDGQVFRRLMLQGEFSSAISALLARRVRMLYSVVEDAHLHSPAVRIARRLEWLVNGITSGRALVNPKIMISQEALAMMLGMSRQTLSMELQKMQDAGWIVLHYRCIEVINVHSLHQFAKE